MAALPLTAGAESPADHLAGAESPAAGNLGGMVVDRDTGAPLAGATVVVTSSALQGHPAEISDENGLYLFSGLPPGVYKLDVYFADVHTELPGQVVTAGATTSVLARIDTSAGWTG